MQLDMTKEEVQTLIGLLDVATKAGGLQVAQHAIPLATKMQVALNAETEEEVQQ